MIFGINTTTDISQISQVVFMPNITYNSCYILSPESLILTGDYNFHVDVEDDPDARAFLDLLTSMGLKQHVNVLTHVSDHTLDLMITREHDPVISSVPVADRYLSNKINQLIDMQSSLEMPIPGEKGCVDSDSCAGVTFANLPTLSQEQVSELIIKAAKKSCPLDPMPILL